MNPPHYDDKRNKWEALSASAREEHIKILHQRSPACLKKITKNPAPEESNKKNDTLTNKKKTANYKDDEDNNNSSSPENTN